MTSIALAEIYWQWFQNSPEHERLLNFVRSSDKTLRDASGDKSAMKSLLDLHNPVFTDFRTLTEGCTGEQVYSAELRMTAFTIFIRRLRKQS